MVSIGQGEVLGFGKLDKVIKIKPDGGGFFETVQGGESQILDSGGKMNRIGSNGGGQNYFGLGKLLTDDRDNRLELLAVLIEACLDVAIIVVSKGFKNNDVRLLIDDGGEAVLGKGEGGGTTTEVEKVEFDMGIVFLKSSLQGRNVLAQSFDHRVTDNGNSDHPAVTTNRGE